MRLFLLMKPYAFFQIFCYLKSIFSLRIPPRLILLASFVFFFLYTAFFQIICYLKPFPPPPRIFFFFLSFYYWTPFCFSLSKPDIYLYMLTLFMWLLEPVGPNRSKLQDMLANLRDAEDMSHMQPPSTPQTRPTAARLNEHDGNRTDEGTGAESLNWRSKQDSCMYCIVIISYVW